MTQQGTGDDGEARMTAAAPQTPAKPPRRQAADLAGARETRHATDREAQDRDVTEEREITEDERLEFFRDSLQQSVLPDLPPIPGFHVCWLSTTHQRDTIAFRRRLGYQLIRAEELPSWEGASMKAGDFEGVIAVNEMVAAKIPLHLYNRYMQEVHHRMPLAEEEKLKSAVDMLKGNAQRSGSGIVEEGDGTANVVQRARPMPEFTQ